MSKIFVSIFVSNFMFLSHICDNEWVSMCQLKNGKTISLCVGFVKSCAC